MRPLPRDFYERDPAKVAVELLGRMLVRRVPGGIMSGIIVETEAYYGKGDPASRASRKMTKLNWLMWERGGLAFIYPVHGNWLLNVTARESGVPGAVLIRALEPADGVDLMMMNRRVPVRMLTSGPGRLTGAMGITSEQNGIDLTLPDSELSIVDAGRRILSVGRSHRIGVRKDLERKLRFFVEGNPYVSR
ncbi:MAG: DNA-3-methyladenine glycosylase [Candidatus Hadarchaeales archaeon]